MFVADQSSVVHLFFVILFSIFVAFVLWADTIAFTMESVSSPEIIPDNPIPIFSSPSAGELPRLILLDSSCHILVLASYLFSSTRIPASSHIFVSISSVSSGGISRITSSVSWLITLIDTRLVSS